MACSPDHLRPRRRRAGRLAATVAVAVAVVLAGGMALAGATMTGRATATHSLSTDTLQPPTSPAASNGPCVVGVSAGVTISWTMTASTWADGYEVLGALVSGGPYTLAQTVAGRSTTSATITGLPFLTSRYYVVRATKANWRSATTVEVAYTTLSSLCT